MELFEICSADGVPQGLMPRDEVHRCGCWHRAAHVLLFHSDGRLWLQQRALDKDIGAGLWDLSVGEHLQPGESYAAGAVRGLREELGLRGVALTALGTRAAFVFEAPQRSICDRELQQAFRGSHDGPLQPDAREVAGVRLVSVAALTVEIGAAPERFTPWLRSTLLHLDLLPRG